MDKRRTKLESEIAGSINELAVNYHFDAGVAMPTMLRDIVRVETRNLTVLKFTAVQPNILLCDICNVVFRAKKMSWDDHVFEDSHFEKMVAKQSVDRGNQKIPSR